MSMDSSIVSFWSKIVMHSKNRLVMELKVKNDENV